MSINCWSCLAWMTAMLVLRPATSAPLSNETVTASADAVTTVASSSTSESASSTTSSPPLSSSTAATPVTPFTSSINSDPVSSSLVPSSSTTTSTTTTEWPEYEASAITQTQVPSETELPAHLDEIRRWPGYWIKTDEAEHEEAQESSVDYRTEIYHIADLFAPRMHPN